MHDFLLAQQIFNKIQTERRGKKLKQIFKVYLEIGIISLAHNNFEEHSEKINLNNLKKILLNLAKQNKWKKIQFFIKKIPGNYWKLKMIEGE